MMRQSYREDRVKEERRREMVPGLFFDVGGQVERACDVIHDARERHYVDKNEARTMQP